jgi:hypothetical protein
MLCTQTKPDNEAYLGCLQLAGFIFNRSSILNINAMTTIFINLLERWVREAVARHGDDWPAIMAFVEEKLEALSDDQREDLSKQLDLVFASQHVLNDTTPN